MSHRCNHITCFVPALLLSLLPCMSACHGHTEEPQDHSDEHFADANEMIVYKTDSTEWRIYTACSDVIYGSDYSVKEPYHIPTRDEAKVLKNISYGDGSQRFVTCDGYTFGMPSSSVTKVGSKTKYSVLGLWVRKSVIIVEF